MITSRPNAPNGTVKVLSSYSPSLFLPGSVVLCRNTSPLVRLCYELISRDVPCRIAGRDLGAGLIGLAKSFKVESITGLRLALSLWLESSVRVCAEENRSPERFYDQHDALDFLAQGLETVEELISRIERVFSDVPGVGVLLSTIHKAKGGEWERVFLLDFHKLLPSKYATTLSALQQERNLQYVAVTRSASELFFIETGKWKEDNGIYADADADASPVSVNPSTNTPPSSLFPLSS